MWCKICGGEIYPGIESVNGTHADADYCVVILNARVEHELARAKAAEKRVAELEEGIKAIDNAVEIQCSDGNWNFDSYMHGMANGLLLAQTYMVHPTGVYDGEHYKPLSAPERWLSDAPTPPPAATE